MVPFDIMYEGWNSDDALPSSGKLELGVACLPELASPWWMNNRCADILLAHCHLGLCMNAGVWLAWELTKVVRTLSAA